MNAPGDRLLPDLIRGTSSVLARPPFTVGLAEANATGEHLDGLGEHQAI
jgi:hypothetical protein